MHQRSLSALLNLLKNKIRLTAHIISAHLVSNFLDVQLDHLHFKPLLGLNGLRVGDVALCFACGKAILLTRCYATLSFNY